LLGEDCGRSQHNCDSQDESDSMGAHHAETIAHGSAGSASLGLACAYTSSREEYSMSLIVLLLILLLVFGGGGFYLGGPRVGGSLGGLILLILIIMLLTGRL
jgi:hypothetical protein